MAEKKEEKKAEKGKKKGRLSPLEKQLVVLAIILGVVFMGVIVGAIIRDNITDKQNQFEWNSFTVHKARLEGTIVDFYFIPIQVQGGGRSDLMFRSDPRSLESISLELNDSLFIGISRAWITTSPDYDSDAIIAAGEVGRLTSAVDIPTGYALTYVEAGEFPEITCKDASEKVRVVDIRIGNETRVYAEGNCIVVEADTNPGMIDAADRLAYHWIEQLFLKKVKFD